ncbi:MAG: glycoside hydrolase family 15 protein [Nitrospirae bacterium]|nr:glycoside hydrolase family 15 protein [Nitrospirota bacterium]
MRIEDYALIGDTQTAALVGRNGSIDWLCLPRFDSGACFASLLGDRRHGYWQVSPDAEVRRTRRHYRQSTLILETKFETDDGVVLLVDFMPPRKGHPVVVRIVDGLSGQVRMRMELVIRLDYGSVIPWVRTREGVLSAVGGPDALYLHTPVVTRGEQLSTVADFSVSKGQRVPFVLTWHPSHEPFPERLDPEGMLQGTEAWWLGWSSHCTYEGEWREQVLRSLITLKALTYGPTGGIVAAPTTSLPEAIGGVRNWDYRFCWLRDATFTLYSLMAAGYKEEACSWRDWLLRAVAGDPAKLQTMYGPGGERRLTETQLPWLPGYEASSPVQIGNAAVRQFQLDVYGEVIDIWEMRGSRQHFTHSKVMAWVAADRAVKGMESFGLSGDVDRWKRLREEIHGEVCEKGYDPDHRTFTQYYGSKELDASLLMIALVGFLPPEDGRVRTTVEAIERELCEGGLVRRYQTETSRSEDGLPPGEGAFLACTFWLADNYWLLGRHQEARQLFERLLALCNDVGLLSEEYDPHTKRLLGNFPQAFSHVSLINTAHNLSADMGPASHRKSA